MFGSGEIPHPFRERGPRGGVNAGIGTAGGHSLESHPAQPGHEEEAEEDDPGAAGQPVSQPEGAEPAPLPESPLLLLGQDIGAPLSPGLFVIFQHPGDHG